MSNERNPKIKSVAREWVESILIALLLAIVIRSYFIQPFKIPSGSMRMTLIEGDHLFVSKLRYGPQILPPVYMEIKPRFDWKIKWPDSLIPLTKKRLPGFSKPHRGDVIVFVFPGDQTKDFIKRLIAVGGETVEIKDGEIYINDQEVTDPNIKNVYYYNRGDYGAPGQKVHVPEGYVFVLGDNSASSHDSRYWGFVPETDIIGKAEFIFWPLDRIRLIK